MIKNERQYRITKSQLERFEKLAGDLRNKPSVATEQLRRQVEIAAAEAQAEELQAQIAEFDGLREGRIPVGELRSLDALPDLLIRARIAAGLTQSALANLLGLKEQQVQRYEATRWGGASLSRLADVARSLNVDVDRGLLDQSSRELPEMVRTAQDSGLEASFIKKRLLPRNTEGTPALLDFAARMNRIFGWMPSRLLAGESGELALPERMAASYKLPARARESRVLAYTVYSHYLALLVLDATRHLADRPLPQTASEFRAALIHEMGGVDFSSVLGFIWSLGIPVLPLTDPGGFHAILMRSAHRNVILLKQQNRSESRWLFDLLHEFRHAIDNQSDPERVVVDNGNSADADDTTEATANLFAGEVLLDGQAEMLAQECVDMAKGRVQLLTQVVPQVAAQHGFETSDLANYMAYRLSLQGINWWGAASNLQSAHYDPWLVTRDEFLSRANLGDLAPLDRELLTQALSE